jgi:hypothetical protein
MAAFDMKAHGNPLCVINAGRTHFDLIDFTDSLTGDPYLCAFAQSRRARHHRVERVLGDEELTEVGKEEDEQKAEHEHGQGGNAQHRLAFLASLIQHCIFRS